MYKKPVMLQNIVIFLHLQRCPCVNKESGFAPSDGLVRSALESSKAPYETAMWSKDVSSLRRVHGSLGTSRCRTFCMAWRCREVPPQRSEAPLLAGDAGGKCFTLMGIDIW